MNLTITTDANSLRSAIETARDAKEELIFAFEENATIDTGEEMPVLLSHTAVTLRGNGATLRGPGTGTGLTLEGGNIIVENLNIEGFTTGVYIKAETHNIRNVTIRGCSFRDIQSASVMTGIVTSGLEIRQVDVNNCYFEAPGRERGGHLTCPTGFYTAVYNTADHPIHNVLLSDVRWTKNRTVPNPEDGNRFSEGLMAHGACNYSMLDNSDIFASSLNDVTHSTLEKLRVEDNDIDGIYDIGITIIASFPARSDCLLEDVVVRNNKIRYFNTGINVGATNQCATGDVKRMYARNILIEDNTLTPQVPGPFEPQIGIMLFTTRCESQLITCVDSHMEDVVVRGNTIYGREVGIAVEAMHGTQELPHPSNVSDCTIRRLTIEKNKIFGAQRPLRIFAVSLESRVDIFWGYEVPPFDKALPYSTLARNNSIDDVVIRENELAEYDCALTLGAAWACGHAFVKENWIGENIKLENNKLDGGRKIFCYDTYVTDELLYEDACGFGNQVICKRPGIR